MIKDRDEDEREGEKNRDVVGGCKKRQRLDLGRCERTGMRLKKA